MASVSKVDTHPKRKQIIAAIIRGDSTQRAIADKYKVSRQSIQRYLKKHLAANAALAMLTDSKEEGAIVLEEMNKVASKMNKMLLSCDEWLQDPENPDRYHLGPRGDEVIITYNIITKKKVNGVVKTMKTRKKESLDDAMKRLTSKQDREILNVTYRHYDPRKLILDTATVITGQLKLMAEIKGAIPDVRVNITISEAWMYLKHVIIDATHGHPEIKKRIIDGIKDSAIEQQ